MNFRSLFMLPDGRLRAGWRLLLFIVIFIAAAVVFHGAASAFFRDRSIISQTAILAASSLAGLASAVVATWLMTSLLEHQPFSSVGLALKQQSAVEVAMGFGIGAGFVGMIAAVEWATGVIHFEPAASGEPVGVLIASGTGILVVSAASEELLFRGYPFQRLVEGTSGYIAILVSSIIFGWLHRLNPHSTNLSVMNTVLAGILLSLGYLKTRALWLPLGFHFSWNWTLALLGLPVSGVDLISMPWQAVSASGHVWVHGGDYGPEGGVVATLVLTAGVIWLLRMRGPAHGPETAIVTVLD